MCKTGDLKSLISSFRSREIESLYFPFIPFQTHTLIEDKGSAMACSQPTRPPYYFAPDGGGGVTGRNRQRRGRGETGKFLGEGAMDFILISAANGYACLSRHKPDRIERDDAGGGVSRREVVRLFGDSRPLYIVSRGDGGHLGNDSETVSFSVLRGIVSLWGRLCVYCGRHCGLMNLAGA